MKRSKVVLVSQLVLVKCMKLPLRPSWSVRHRYMEYMMEYDKGWISHPSQSETIGAEKKTNRWAFLTHNQHADQPEDRCNDTFGLIKQKNTYIKKVKSSVWLSYLKQRLVRPLAMEHSSVYGFTGIKQHIHLEHRSEPNWLNFFIWFPTDKIQPDSEDKNSNTVALLSHWWLVWDLGCELNWTQCSDPYIYLTTG